MGVAGRPRVFFEALLEVEVIAKDDVPAGPLALLARRDPLVTRALGNDLALELGKGQLDIES
jgi:hypothetical protein